MTDEKDPRDPVVPVRLPAAWLGRLDRVAMAMQGEELALIAGRPSRSTAVRLAVIRGLVELERERGIGPDGAPVARPIRSTRAKPRKPARRGKR